LGRVRAAKLNIHSWSTTERLRLFTDGRYLKELWEDSVVLAPLEPRARKARVPTTTSPDEAVPGRWQIGEVEHDHEDTPVDQIIREHNALHEDPEMWKELADPASQKGRAIHQLVAQNLIGKAAARLTTEVNSAVDEHGLTRLAALHPAARNMQYLATGQQQPRPEGLPKLNITVEHIIQAAQTAPRGSCGGLDSLHLDLLTQPLRRADAIKYREAGAAERASNPTYAYLEALQGVIQQFADGDVPAAISMAIFSATGLALSKPDGGIRPIACGVSLRRLACRAVVRASTDNLQAALGATQFGVCHPGGAEACKLGLETYLINSDQE
jgi:hypothetical protein